MKTAHFGPQSTTQKFKRIEIIQCQFSDCNGIKSEMNNRKITEKSQNIWKLKSTFLNNIWIKEEITRQL